MKNAAIDLHGRVKSRVGCTEDKDEAKGRKILEISTTFTVEGSSKGVSSYTTSEIEKNTSEALLVDSVPKECVWVDAVDQRVIGDLRSAEAENFQLLNKIHLDRYCASCDRQRGRQCRSQEGVNRTLMEISDKNVF